MANDAPKMKENDNSWFIINVTKAWIMELPEQTNWQASKLCKFEVAT